MTPIIKELPKFENKKEENIYKAILEGAKSVESISKSTEYEMSDLLISLSMLEIDGHIFLDEM